MSNLNSIREEINDIDAKLVELFKQRMDCAKQVGEYKKENDLPILNQDRENEILDIVEKDGGEYGYASRLLFSNIMELSRALQHDIVGSGIELKNALENAKSEFKREEKSVRVACQGINGANSHQATNVVFPNGEPVFEKTWEDVFKAVKSGDVKYGVLPVENSSAGSVSDVYDLLIKYKFFVVATVDINIKHCLCGIKGSSLNDIKKVLSHPQGLSQCSNFISDNNLKPIPFDNTATAAYAVKEKNDISYAAICSSKAADEYGLEILKTDFQNSLVNRTRFIVISKEMIIEKNSSKISLCFSLPHTTGSLYNALGRFSTNGLNLTKIESRPMLNKNFEYLFYLDFTGNVLNNKTKKLLCALSQEMPNFNFFGNYKEVY